MAVDKWRGQSMHRNGTWVWQERVENPELCEPKFCKPSWIQSFFHDSSDWKIFEDNLHQNLCVAFSRNRLHSWHLHQLHAPNSHQDAAFTQPCQHSNLKTQIASIAGAWVEKKWYTYNHLYRLQHLCTIRKRRLLHTASKTKILNMYTFVHWCLKSWIVCKNPLCSLKILATETKRQTVHDESKTSDGKGLKRVTRFENMSRNKWKQKSLSLDDRHHPCIAKHENYDNQNCISMKIQGNVQIEHKSTEPWPQRRFFQLIFQQIQL